VDSLKKKNFMAVNIVFALPAPYNYHDACELMPVETDFAYLKSQVSRREDLAKLEAIAEDRRRIRFEDAILTDTRFFDIRFGELLFYFRRDLAPASLDTYIEIFRNQTHMLIPDFQPENNSLILDIGANEGFYSLYMKYHNRDIHLVSVEPVPDIFEILTRNIQANGFNEIQALNVALSDRTGTGVLETYPHVSSISSHDIMQLKRPWTRPGRIRKISVRQTTLPALFSSLGLEVVDLLKLDVEGSELKTLKSGESVLKRIKKLVVEWHTSELREDCKRFLQARNFKLVHEECRRTGDSYFINRSLS
jgi:FkbM family methyltransferase